ncbi:MAG TPA: hypothetical protein PLH65_00395 [bacterium]|nr:hypothetical protein [bacterium]
MVLSWNIFIIFCVLISVLYGFILQRNKIVLTLLNVYIALSVVGVLGNSFNNIAQRAGEAMLNQGFAERFFSLFITQTFLFVALIIILSIRGEHAKALGDVKVQHPMILSFIYSVLFALIVSSTILSFLPVEVQSGIVQQSNIVGWIMAKQVWWVVTPVILMIVTSYFIVPEE